MAICELSRSPPCCVMSLQWMPSDTTLPSLSCIPAPGFRAQVCRENPKLRCADSRQIRKLRGRVWSSSVCDRFVDRWTYTAATATCPAALHLPLLYRLTKQWHTLDWDYCYIDAQKSGIHWTELSLFISSSQWHTLSYIQTETISSMCCQTVFTQCKNNVHFKRLPLLAYVLLMILLKNPLSLFWSLFVQLFEKCWVWILHE